MGRRKIEIQPILQERNRSVTFLKRKNGLFKKAYELGVLCSVDVAVIIFEERPGHHLKLYQYCSSDVHDIVQRQLRHDGEKDTKGPNDFSGNASSKADDADGDEDDVDDDDDLPPRSKRSRNEGGRLKLPSDMATSASRSPNDDYTHRNISMPQHPIGIQSGASSGSGLPISTLRTNSGGGGPPSSRHLRQTTSRSPSDDTSLPGPAGPYHYSGPPSQQNNFSRGGYGQPPPHHHGPGAGASNNGGGYSSPFYNAQTPPQPPFMPLSTDFPPSRGSGGRGGPQSGNFPPRSNTSFDQGMYPPQAHGGLVRQSSTSTGGGGPNSGGGADLFSFLEDGHPRQATSSGFGLDWPVGAPGSATGSSSSSSGAPPPSTTSSNSADWLEFLSGNNAGPGNNAQRGPPGGGTGGPGNTSSALSWERGGGPPGAVTPVGPNDRNNSSSQDLADLFAAATNTGSRHSHSHPSPNSNGGRSSRSDARHSPNNSHAGDAGTRKQRIDFDDTPRFVGIIGPGSMLGSDGGGPGGGMVGVSRGDSSRAKVEMKE